MSDWNFMLSWVEHEIIFITLGPGVLTYLKLLHLNMYHLWLMVINLKPSRIHKCRDSDIPDQPAHAYDFTVKQGTNDVPIFRWEIREFWFIYVAGADFVRCASSKPVRVVRPQATETWVHLSHLLSELRVVMTVGRIWRIFCEWVARVRWVVVVWL